MDKFETIKAELDKQLEVVSANVGIAFGDELFEEFRRRSWFTLETFSALGTSLFSHKVPAYKQTHFALKSWDIQKHEFKVGKNQ